MRSIARSATTANSASLRTDAPNSSRNAGPVLGDEAEVRGEALLDPLAAAGRAARSPRRGARRAARPTSSSSSRYSARFDGKCWYSTGFVTPGGLGDLVHRGGVEAAARAKTSTRDLEELVPALLGGEPHRRARRDAVRRVRRLDFSGIS